MARTSRILAADTTAIFPDEFICRLHSHLCGHSHIERSILNSGRRCMVGGLSQIVIETTQVWFRRSSVTQKFVRSLSSVCPRINYDWIWTGEGDMLREVLSSGALPADRLSELDRFSFIMSEMAQLMKNFSSVVCPLERRVAELERRVAEQNNTIDQLRLRLDRMEKAATP
ncbi:hypothetical protein [Duncaniella muris]|uniref:hypothetical protein n=1 Tax=Duncaniella muris TaxID=2094150 RepID=UPI00272A1756|nr:hypothetical protein [Duncaniella muris]